MEKTKDGRRVWKWFDQDPVEDLVLTNRNLEFIQTLEALLYMDTDQMRRLYSNEFVRVHIKNLFRHKLIARIGAQRQVRMHKGGGSSCLIYSLTNLGVSHIPLSKRIHPKRDWDERNRDIKPWSLPHPLGVSSIAVAFAAASREENGIVARRLDKEVMLKATGRRRGVKPDLTHIFEQAAMPDGAFFHELHTGSETQSRNTHKHLQFLAKKDIGYLSYLRSKRLMKDFGVKRARILKTVAGGEEMKKNTAATSLAVCGGAGVDRFLVTTQSELETHGALAPIWMNAAGQITSLLE